MRRVALPCCLLVVLTACAASPGSGLPPSPAPVIARMRVTHVPAPDVATIVTEVCCWSCGRTAGGSGVQTASTTPQAAMTPPAAFAEDGCVVVTGTPERVREMLELIERLDVAVAR